MVARSSPQNLLPHSHQQAYLGSCDASEANYCGKASAAKSLQSCPTLCDPIDGSPPGSPVPAWDSPGKNTGVGCHFLLQCMKVKTKSEAAQSCPTLSDSMDCSLPRLLHPWGFPGKSTGVGCHCLLRTIARSCLNFWNLS